MPIYENDNIEGLVKGAQERIDAHARHVMIAIPFMRENLPRFIAIRKIAENLNDVDPKDRKAKAEQLYNDLAPRYLLK